MSKGAHVISKKDLIKDGLALLSQEDSLALYHQLLIENSVLCRLGSY